ncbi:hypothetical protein GIB67_031765 [Kingdonia uniflora]|uniref:BED-type domain-containing protein n=1 Tax=Kingdonia uniflora TaxID=39325 RepID=A0A7J7NWB4_9MAGN|nr:hypothetical protein GIB67_031765 [Kingdonia uniflora]
MGGRRKDDSIDTGSKKCTQTREIREVYQEVYKESLIGPLEAELSRDFKNAVILWILDPLEWDAKDANEVLKMKKKKGVDHLKVIVEIVCAASPHHLMAVRQIYYSLSDCSPEEDITTYISSPVTTTKGSCELAMLAERMHIHGASGWLVNTGWSGGEIGVPAEILKLKNSCMDKEAYNDTLIKLGDLFKKNSKPTYHGITLEEVKEADDDYQQMWQFYYVVLLDAQCRFCLRMLAEDAITAEDEKAGFQAVGVMEEEAVKGYGEWKYASVTSSNALWEYMRWKMKYLMWSIKDRCAGVLQYFAELDEEGKSVELDRHFWCGIFREILLDAELHEAAVREIALDKLAEEDERIAGGKIIPCGENVVNVFCFCDNGQIDTVDCVRICYGLYALCQGNLRSSWNEGGDVAMEEERDHHDNRIRYPKSNDDDIRQKYVPAGREGDADMFSMRSKNRRPSSNFIVSTTTEMSSSSGRSEDHIKVRDSIVVEVPMDVQSTVEEVPSLDLWKKDRRIGDDVEISYYNGTGDEVLEDGFLCYLNQLNWNVFEMIRVCEALNEKCREDGTMRQFVAANVLKFYKIKYVKARKSGYLYSDSARPKFFDFESVGRPWNDHLVMVKGNCMQVPGEPALKLIFKCYNLSPEPKGITDTSSLFDCVAREEVKLKQVLGELNICRDKRAQKGLKDIPATVEVDLPPLPQKQKQEIEGRNRSRVKEVDLEELERSCLELARMSRSAGDFYDHCVKVGPKAVQCNYCNKVITAGITRFKEHLSTQRGSVIECPNALTDLRKLAIQALQEMRQNKRSHRQLRDWEPQGSSHDDSDEVEDITDSFGDASKPDYHPEEGSGGESQPTRAKSTGLLNRLFRRGRGSNEGLTSRSSSLSLRAPARHSVDLHSQNPRRETQQTIPNMMGGGSSSRDYACGKITSMFCGNAIPFNIASSQSYHEAFNSVANYGKTFRPPTAYEIANPFLQKEKWRIEETVIQRQRLYWKDYGCTLMADSWKDKAYTRQFSCLLPIRGHSNRRDLIRPSLTRFATSFIAIRSIMENQVHLQQLFVDTEYRELSYAKLSTSKAVQKIVMSDDFWKKPRSDVAMIGKLPFKPGCMGSEAARITAQQGSPNPLCEWIAGDDDEPLLPTHEEWVEELERELSAEDPEVNEQMRCRQMSVVVKVATEVFSLNCVDRAELTRKAEEEKALLKEHFEGENAWLREQLEEEKKKVVDALLRGQALEVVRLGRNNLIQSYCHWGLSDYDIKLGLEGKYEAIVFPEDDVSPVVATSPPEDQIQAPVAVDTSNAEEEMQLREKVSSMEKTLSGAGDSVNRTQKAYLELLKENGIVPDPARVRFLAQEARNRHSVEAINYLARAGVSIVWGGVGLLPDVLGAKNDEDFRVKRVLGKTSGGWKFIPEEGREEKEGDGSVAEGDVEASA